LIRLLHRPFIFRLLSYSLLAFLFLQTFLRLFKGIDISDEAYYLGLPQLFFQGHRPFNYDILPHQGAALVVAPFVYLWNLYSPGEGGFLFLRLLFFSFQVLVSAYFFKVFAKKTQPLFAAILVLVFINFVPFGIVSASYNNLAMLFLALFVINTYDQQMRITRIGWCSLFIAAFCYPSLLGLGAAVVLGKIVFHHQRFKMDLWEQKGTLFFLLFLGVCFLGFVSPKAIFETFHNSSSLQIYRLDSSKLFQIFQDQITHALQFFQSTSFKVSIALLIVFSADLFFKGRLSDEELYERVTFALMIVFFTAWIEFMIKGVQLGSLVNSLLIPIILIWGYEFIKKRSFEIFSILIVCLLAGFIFSLTSTNGTLNSSFGMAPLLLLTAVTLFSQLSSNWQKQTLIGLSLVTLTLLCLSQSSTIYRDDAPHLLTQKITFGPGKGLYTTPEKFAYLQNLKIRLDTHIPRDSTVMFSDDFPLGYLLTQAKAETPSIWILPPYSFPQLDRSVYSRVLKERSIEPTYFVEVKTIFHTKDSQIQIADRSQDPLFQTIMSLGYEKTFEDPLLVVWKTKKP